MNNFEFLSNLAGVLGIGSFQIGAFVFKSIRIYIEKRNRNSSVIIDGGEAEGEEIKKEIAIIIDMGTMSIKSSVYEFLEAKNIDSTVFVCNNPNGYVHMDLNNQDEWTSAVKGIYTLINEIYTKIRPEKVHIFLSAPATLTFAIGYVLRPFCTPYLYQYNQKYKSEGPKEKLYSNVLYVSDALK